MRPDSPRDFGAILIIYLLTYLLTYCMHCVCMQMVQHEDYECPLKVVSCFFEPLGCDHRVLQLYCLHSQFI